MGGDDEPVDPLIGKTIDGRYRVRAVLGRGGMGSVYEVEHVALHKVFALKLSADRDPAARRRFLHEARALSRIAHPGVVRVVEFGSLPRADYLVLELVPGQDLRAILRAGPLPAARAVAILRQVLDALHVIHEAGIVHRDVKPSNIAIGEGDVAKLMDFGIAHTLGDAHVTQAAQVVGTPTFMAPEQLVAGEVDRRADVYAAGITLYALLAGDVPFDDASFTKLAARHLGEPPPLDALPRETPPSLRAALACALAKSPDDRFPTARAFADALGDPAYAAPAPAARGRETERPTVAERPAATPPKR